MQHRPLAAALAAIALFSSHTVAAHPKPSAILETLRISDIATLEQAVPVILRDGTKLNATIITPSSGKDHASFIEAPVAL